MWTVTLMLAALGQSPAPSPPPPAMETLEIFPPAPPSSDGEVEVPRWSTAAWMVDVASGTGVGLVLGVAVPLVLGGVAEAVVLGAAYQISRGHNGWEDLVSVVVAMLGTLVVVPATLIAMPCLEGVGFAVGASAVALTRKLTPSWQTPLDQADQPARRRLRTWLAPVGVVAVTLPVALLMTAALLAAGAAVPLTLVLTSNTTILSSSPWVLPVLLGAGALGAWLVLLLEVGAVFGLRPLAYAGWLWAEARLARPVAERADVPE